jgi:hypothetical protein
VSTKQTENQGSKLLQPFANSSARMGLSLTGGGLAWTFHLLASALLTEWGAVAGLGDRSLLGINLIAWAVIAVTGLSVAAALWALRETVQGLGRYRQLKSRQESVDNARESAARSKSLTGAYLMAVGVYSNCVFLLVILAQALPVFFYWGAR